jgi:L-rhamnose mutarotase
MYKSNIRNFTIYYHQETSTLFHHFEWVGHWYRGDPNSVISVQNEKAWFDADMQAVAADPIVKEWWTHCELCQEPFSQWLVGSPPPSEGGRGDWWAPLLCVNHCGHWPIEYSDKRRDPDFIPQNPDGTTSPQPKQLPPDDRDSSPPREQ